MSMTTVLIAYGAAGLVALALGHRRTAQPSRPRARPSGLSAGAFVAAVFAVGLLVAHGAPR